MEDFGRRAIKFSDWRQKVVKRWRLFGVHMDAIYLIRIFINRKLENIFKL